MRAEASVLVAQAELRYAAWRWGQALVAAHDVGGVELERLSAVTGVDRDGIDGLICATRAELARQAGDRENALRQQRRERAAESLT